MAGNIVKIDPARPEEAFFPCKKVISGGGIIVYPTDTFYGLGVDPRSKEAVRRLFEIKGRSGDQPILLLLPRQSDVALWAAHVNPEAERLMLRYWPGPLTLVFQAKEEVLSLLTAGRGTIGLRVPGNTVTRQLLEYLGAALTGTSANISGRENPRTAEEAALAFGDRVDLILDSGPAAAEKPSTVVDVSRGQVRVIREGALQL